MANAKDLSPLTGGVTVSVIGEPKSGKSHMARTARKVGSVFAFLAPEELMSYAGEDIEYDLVCDEGWRPASGQLEATAFPAINARLNELEKRTDAPKTVLFDTGNATFGDALWNWTMKSYGVGDPRELGGNSRDPYRMYAERLREFITRLQLLRMRKGCHIIVCWHQDIRELEGLGAARKETETTKTGSKTTTHWDVARLPTVRGAMRGEVIRAFDLSFYVEPVIGSQPPRSKLITVPPDVTRVLAGTRFPAVHAALAKIEVPNDFEKLLKLIEQHYKAPEASKGETKP